MSPPPVCAECGDDDATMALCLTCAENLYTTPAAGGPVRGTNPRNEEKK